MICVFFGHRFADSALRPRLHRVIGELIAEGIDTFYVGHQGAFDAMVRAELRAFRERYPHIRHAVVLACLPTEKDGEAYEDTLFPDGLEGVPPRFAIDRRNRWMVEAADVVVTCAVAGGGADKFRQIALKKGKRVIDLSAFAVSSEKSDKI